ncbi:hypothetical protein ACFYST_12050 [Kitasatospora sp. NPDC004614]|uniref:hypothetical protein n=1 Tax=unclassified Kitasatospora TaxID=2633591 RepID=UPI00369AD0C0
MRFPTAVKILAAVLAFVALAVVLLVLVGRTDPASETGSMLRAGTGGLLAGQFVLLCRVILRTLRPDRARRPDRTRRRG